MLGIAAVTFAVDRGEDWGWASAQTLGLFAAGALLLIAFVAIERRATWPLIDLSLFGNRPYVAITMLGLTANVVFVVTTFAATLYLQDVRGYSPLEGGFIFLAASVMQAVAGPLSGRLAERFDVPRVMAASIAIGAVGLLIVAAGARDRASTPLALPVFGLGYGLCWAMLSVGTQAVVPTEQAGAASGRLAGDRDRDGGPGRRDRIGADRVADHGEPGEGEVIEEHPAGAGDRLGADRDRAGCARRRAAGRRARAGVSRPSASPTSRRSRPTASSRGRTATSRAAPGTSAP